MCIYFFLNNTSHLPVWIIPLNQLKLNYFLFRRKMYEREKIISLPVSTSALPNNLSTLFTGDQVTTAQ